MALGSDKPCVSGLVAEAKTLFSWVRLTAPAQGGYRLADLVYCSVSR